MKFCEFCGAQMEDDHKFCLKCGKKEIDYGQQVTPPPVMPSQFGQQTPPQFGQKTPLQYGQVPESQPETPKRGKKSKAPVIFGICGGVAIVSIVVGILFANGVFSLGGGDKNYQSVAVADKPSETDPGATEKPESTTAPAVGEAEPEATEAPADQDTQTAEETPLPTPDHSNAKPDEKIDVYDGDAEDESYQYTDNESNYYEDDSDDYSDDYSDSSYDYDDSDDYSGSSYDYDDYSSSGTDFSDSYVYPKGSDYKLASKKLKKKDIKKILKLKELKGLNKFNKINMVIQVIYAYHGYKFGNPNKEGANPYMPYFFNAKNWYYGGETYDESEVKSKFNSIEKKNVDFLVGYRNKYSSTGKNEDVREYLENKGLY